MLVRLLSFLIVQNLPKVNMNEQIPIITADDLMDDDTYGVA
jgi:hypothetical protein